MISPQIDKVKFTMTDTNPVRADFMAQVQVTQTIWALQDQASEGWVVLDSVNFENTDVMPVWSSMELAQNHCIDEWQDYVPKAITLAEWLEFWVEDLAEDNVLIGVEWRDGGEYLELELAEFSQMIAKIETL
jgi:hypothetical protein